MRERLGHRGPDSGGQLVDEDVALGVRRLRVIDKEGGEQPIGNEDSTVWVVQNGEIYNFASVRQTLSAYGHSFATRSDTEVIVHAYEQYGADLARELDGMFAFAVWDHNQRRLVVARDRMGKKPLVYATLADGTLAFASEIAALLVHPGVQRSIDRDALDLYLTLGYIPAPRTAFHGVSKLPPAHVLQWQAGQIQIQRYWAPPAFGSLEIGEQDASDELLRRLRRAVSERLVADVPLGAFLSGGIDSSAVVALMAEQTSRVRTFAIGFKDAAYSELEHARRVAQRYGTEHEEFIVEPMQADVLPMLARHFGEPFADSSALPTYQLAALTRSHVTVALSGDGGDDTLGGYDRHVAMGLAGRVPGPEIMRRLMLRAAGSVLPRNAPSKSLVARAGRFARAAALPAAKRYLEWVRVVDGPTQRALTGRDSEAAPRLMEAAMQGRDDSVEAALAADVALYLPGDLLPKADIASMSASLEVRSPFLATSVVELAVALPRQLKVHGTRRKGVLRDAVASLVPSENMDRPKMGFAIPVDRWFREDLRELTHDTVLSPRALQRGYLDEKAVTSLVAEHLAGRRQAGSVLWVLLMLELWHREVVDAA